MPTAPKYTIGVCQLVTHDALDAATQGFIDAVKDKLGEENVTIDVQNAANDQNVCTTIVNTFVSKKVDLIMANATPALQAAYNATAEIPFWVPLLPSTAWRWVSTTSPAPWAAMSPVPPTWRP